MFPSISLVAWQCVGVWCRYALLGAASFLGGSMRMTVSLCVIMVEITNNLKLLPLIMLVLLISKVITKPSLLPWMDWYRKRYFFYFLLQAVGDAFNEGLYEEQARLRGIPLLESRPKNLMRKMTAKEACGNQKVRRDHTKVVVLFVSIFLLFAWKFIFGSSYIFLIGFLLHSRGESCWCSQYPKDQRSQWLPCNVISILCTCFCAYLIPR